MHPIVVEKQNVVAELCKRFSVARLEVFGSAAGGRFEDSRSDLDFLVQLEKKTFDAYMDLKFYLEDLFQRPVDLVLKDAIKPRLRAAIEESAVYAQGL